MSEPKIYLAGPMTGLTFNEAVARREEIRRLLPPNFILLSPLRGKEFLQGKGKLKPVYGRSNPMSTSKGITARDRWDVSRCDAVLADLRGVERVSIGTCVEFGWADAYRKPLITVMEPDNPHDHAMIREISMYLVPDIEEACDLLKVMFQEDQGTDIELYEEQEKWLEGVWPKAVAPR